MQSHQSKIIVLDTSLRDGEQAPGASMTLSQKVEIALSLEQLGVDVIEGGFAASSANDFHALVEIAKNSKNTIISCLCRAIDSDILAAAQALKHAPKSRVNLFISTSDIHLKNQFHWSRQAVLERIKYTTTLARTHVDDVQFCFMDATRTEVDFLLKAVEVAVHSGAKTIDIADTVGYSVPEEFSFLIQKILNDVKNIDKAILSVHCHNDLGLAVANTLAGLQAGARQFDATINGIGERAGNAALEEVIMAIKTRPQFYPFITNVKPKYFCAISKKVAEYTGFTVQKNKAIVGENAFSHASGIHQDGVIKHAANYEIMQPGSVGWSGNQMIISRHSGHAGLQFFLKKIQINLSVAEYELLFSLLKNDTHSKKIISESDLIKMIKKIKNDGVW